MAFLLRCRQSIQFLMILIAVFFFCPSPCLSSNPHRIVFRSPDRYPESVVWDPSAEYFLVSSIRHRSIASVSDAGVVETLVVDDSLPANATILGLAVDSIRRRVLCVIHTLPPSPQFDALAAYDTRSRRRIFLSHLPVPNGSSTRPVANDVAVDHGGNAYVTNSGGNFIWRVTVDGEASVFSQSPVYTSQSVDRSARYSDVGLNGIAYVSKGYLLVVQSNTGKMFKVNAYDGTARVVPLNEDLRLADGITVRRDGVVVVASPDMAWFLKSDDSWGQGVVYDRTALDAERFCTSVAVGGGDRTYVLYGHLEEGFNGDAHRESFAIEEIRSERESRDENVLVYVLIGFGLAYFVFWRFQMRRLFKTMNEKRA